MANNGGRGLFLFEFITLKRGSGGARGGRFHFSQNSSSHALNIVQRGRKRCHAQRAAVSPSKSEDFAGSSLPRNLRVSQHLAE